MVYTCRVLDLNFNMYFKHNVNISCHNYLSQINIVSIAKLSLLSEFSWHKVNVLNTLIRERLILFIMLDSRIKFPFPGTIVCIRFSKSHLWKPGCGIKRHCIQYHKQNILLKFIQNMVLRFSKLQNFLHIDGLSQEYIKQNLA